jgi:hypothetical protein
MSTEVREHASRLNMKPTRVSARPLGLTPGELVAAALAIIFFAAAVVYYFTALAPERERLKALEATMESQQQVMRASLADMKSPDVAPQTDAPTDALNSLLLFKGQHLKPLNKGRIDLINEINALAKKNNAQLTSGIEMSLQSVVQDEQSDSSKKNNKKKESLDVFPHLAIHFEVAGSYASLRGFISELEKSRQFLVLDSVNLTSIEAGGGEGGSGGGASGINLSINMTAYFQP